MTVVVELEVVVACADDDKGMRISKAKYTRSDHKKMPSHKDRTFKDPPFSYALSPAAYNRISLHPLVESILKVKGQYECPILTN